MKNMENIYIMFFYYKMSISKINLRRLLNKLYNLNSDMKNFSVLMM